MKKFIIFFAIVLLMQETRLEAQVTSPTFDPVWAAKLQDAINTALPTSGAHGVSVAISFPGMGTFIGVAGESAPGIPMTSDMQFGIGSNTKTFTAVLALKLQELGILSLDDPISKFFPPHPYIDGSATIRQCLLHQTGFEDYDNSIRDWIPDTMDTHEKVLSILSTTYFPVGKGFKYSNTNYHIVGMVMEAATGKTYTELLHQYIFDPLHLDSTFLAWYEEPNGNVAHGYFHGEDVGNIPLNWFNVYWAASGIFSTANEMVQWYDNLFAGNVINQSSLAQLRSFEPSSFFGLGLQYRYTPLLPDEVVNGHGGEVPGYSSDPGFDIKRQSSSWILTNVGGDRRGEIGNFILPVVNAFYLGYTKKQNDAGIIKVFSPVGETCNTQITAQVELKNFGTANLTSAIINYQLDGGTVHNYNWTGNLQPDQTTMVSLPAINTSPGNHSFRSFTSNPNGNVDGYPYYDEARSSFSVNGSVLPNSINEGFEGRFPPPGWVNGNGNILNWGKTSLVSLNGSSCAVKENMDDFTFRSYDLELPLMNISLMKDPVLSFNYAYSVLHGHADGLSVLVSKNCGATYTTLFDRSGSALKTCSSTEIFFPKQDEWGRRTIDLSSYKGEALIKFRAKSDFGNNLYIDNANISDVTDLCAAPTDLNEVQITSSSVKLSWKFQGNADHFDIYYHPKTLSSWIHKTAAGNKQWINVSGLLSSTDYEWYITATCSSGNSLPSARSYFTTDPEQAGITSLSTFSPEVPGIQGQLKIFPNPTKGRSVISFTSPKAGRVSLTVYDITGRLVKTITNGELNEGDHTFKLDVNNFKVGIYLLRMQSGQISQTRKFIVQH